MKAALALPFLALVVASTASNLPYTKHKLASSKKGKWDTSAEYIQIKGASPVVKLANAEFKKYATRSKHEFIAQAIKDQVDYKPRNPYSFDLTCRPVTLNKDLVSAEFTLYVYTDGAHPNTMFIASNFGTVAGKAKSLVLADLFKKDSDAFKKIGDYVMGKLKDKGASFVSDGSHGPFTKEEGEMFTIKPGKLVYHFSPYEMASYAEGDFTIDVPFSLVKDDIDPKGPLAKLKG